MKYKYAKKKKIILYDYENFWNIILINGCVIWAYVLLMSWGIAWIIIVDITFIARFLHASKAKKVTTFVKITEDDKLIYYHAPYKKGYDEYKEIDLADVYDYGSYTITIRKHKYIKDAKVSRKGFMMKNGEFIEFMDPFFIDCRKNKKK